MSNVTVLSYCTNKIYTFETKEECRLIVIESERIAQDYFINFEIKYYRYY